MRYIKHVLTLLVLYYSVTGLFGQTIDTSRYTFIQYDKNALVFPKGTQRYSALFQKIRTLQDTHEGTVNIMHIGGSHVQAGVWTEGLCHAMESRMQGIPVSRGFIFPYEAIGTTQPGDYMTGYKGIWNGCKNTQRNIDCPLGVMGVSATTKDSSASLFITARSGRGKLLQAQRVRIFHPDDSTQFTFSFPHDSLAVYTRDSSDTFTLVEFSRTTDTLFLQVQKTDSIQRGFSLYGIRLEKEQSGIYIDAIGNNGADLPAYLRCTLFEEQLKTAVPDLVILSLGINDAYTRHFDAEQYKRNYRALIAKIRSVAPACAILFTTNNDSYYRRRYPNGNGVKVQQAIMELADEYEAGVWDLFAVMGGSRSINQWVSARLARTDRIHFTTGGYLLIGELLSDAFITAMREYHTQPQTGG